ncbi:PPC domain-containing DNA-binding protein [Halorhabdus sp. BNX81]|uniref:PPC domain-containing DNA-binding protein n=1 Tax=Halorhabdus sp. BNX81 TaxID=2980181 RepID=UPI0023DD127F|nr:PPC domain-containing DNA-binding protein [Halorhabdus sp. BNX81]WEL22030.1 DNA-binding protein [Halorhabdus sp. BNX81]
MRTFEGDNGEVVVQLEPGDKALESIETAIDEHDIDTGYVASGIGSLTQLHIHYVSGYDSFPDFPDEDEEIDEYIKEEAAWEVGSLQGAIADGEPHLHITAFDAERDKMLAGHLEPDSIVHALMEIVIQPIEGLELTRRPEQMDIPMLQQQ